MRWDVYRLTMSVQRCSSSYLQQGMRSSQGATKHAEIEGRHNDGNCSPRSSPAPSYNSQHPMRLLQSRQAGLRQTLKGCEQDLQKPNLNAGANYQQHRRSGDFSIGEMRNFESVLTQRNIQRIHFQEMESPVMLMYKSIRDPVKEKQPRYRDCFESYERR